MTSKIQALTEQLEDKNKQLQQARQRFVKLSERKRQEAESSSKSLNESISEKDKKILKLTEAIKTQQLQSENM